MKTRCLAVCAALLLVSCSTKKEDEALLYGAKNGDERIVEMALAHGARVNVRDESGWSPLLHAAARGHSGVVSVLLKKGPEVDCRTEAGVTPLMASALDGHVVVMQQLLASGADIHAVSRTGNTSLMASASRIHIGGIKTLLARGARVNAQNGAGETALMLLVQGSYLKVLEESHVPPQILRAAREDLLECIRILLKSGADFRIKDNAGKTTLMHAREAGNPEVVEVFRVAITKAS